MIVLRTLIQSFYNYSSPIIIVLDNDGQPIGVLRKQVLVQESARGHLQNMDVPKIIKKYAEKIDYEELLALLEEKNNLLPAIDISGQEIVQYSIEIPPQEEEIPLGIALQSLPVGIIICSNLNNIVYINRTAQRLIGKKENEALGKKFDALFKDSKVTEAFKVSATVFEIRIGTEPQELVFMSRVIKRGEKKLGTILVLLDLDIVKKIYSELPDAEE